MVHCVDDRLNKRGHKRNTFSEIVKGNGRPKNSNSVHKLMVHLMDMSW